MCDNDSSDFAEYSAQGFGDRRLGVDIEGREGVIENQDARLGQDRSGQR